MFDTLLNIGASFDLISPVLAFVTDAIMGPIADFGIDANAGWNIADIKHLFNQNQIFVWGMTYTIQGDVLIFTVSDEDSEDTFLLLRHVGIPILYMPSIDT